MCVIDNIDRLGQGYVLNVSFFGDSYYHLSSFTLTVFRDSYNLKLAYSVLCIDRYHKVINLFVYN